VDIAPQGGHSVECASVCVSTLSTDPSDCDTWHRASRHSEGILRAVVPEAGFDPVMCTAQSYVHVRLRVTHTGACDI
jgi:hypothetical protein